MTQEEKQIIYNNLKKYTSKDIPIEKNAIYSALDKYFAIVDLMKDLGIWEEYYTMRVAKRND